MPTRFFVDPSMIAGDHVTFRSEDAHHMSAVLKMRTGDDVVAMDGTGVAYSVTITQLSKNRAEGAVTGRELLNTEPSLSVVVAQALPKKLDKLEWILQHGTEAGAAGFLIFTSERGRADAERLQGKRDRWQEIVRSAAEQSHRAKLPLVEGIIPFSGLSTRYGSFETVLVAYENEQATTLKSVLTEKMPTSTLILIGPEGGFTEGEILQTQAHGARSVSLGPRILRTETAALVALSQIMYASEDAQA